MLPLDYQASIPTATLALMERAARRLGLPLGVIERLGQNPTLCAAFAAAEGRRDEARIRFLAEAITTVVAQPPRAHPPPPTPLVALRRAWATG